VIKVNKLVKKYQTYDRREGIAGSVKDLFNRNYKELTAVDEISFDINEGELIGYIGPNGAGKSTSIKMLTGILKPTSGDINVFGFHPFYQRKQYAQIIGVVFGQRTQLWWDIAVRESLNLLAKIYSVSDADYKKRMELFNDVLGLEKLLKRPVRKLSLGERMRCDLAASLIHNPKVLFLDEPTIGLDQVAKDSIREFLREINKELKTTIILTTHDLKEIEELCEKIIVLDSGKIVYNGMLEKVKNLPGLKRILTVDFASEFSNDSEIKKLSNKFKASFEFETNKKLIAKIDPSILPVADVVKEIVSNYKVADISISEPSIEQVISKIYKDGVN